MRYMVELGGFVTIVLWGTAWAMGWLG